MAYQSKTYSLSDGVVAAIDKARAAGETPNRYLQRLIRMEQAIPLTETGEARQHTVFCGLGDNHIGVCRQSVPSTRETNERDLKAREKVK